MKTLFGVGSLYLLSGLWCAWQPGLASAYLGFSLTGPLAESEFFSVYGGLQVGLAVGMISCACIARYVEAGLFFSTLFSSTLFSFRLMSIVLFGLEENVLLMLLLEAGIALSLLHTWRGTRRIANTE